MLAEAYRAHGLRSISFRYFNAAGAAPEAGIGENHEPETHLIPNVLRSCLSDNWLATQSVRKRLRNP